MAAIPTSSPLTPIIPTVTEYGLQFPRRPADSGPGHSHIKSEQSERSASARTNESTVVGSSLQAFSKCIRLLELSDPREAAVARSNLARFKLWASSVGAQLTSGTQSLNYRLRDSYRTRSHAESLLEELQNALTEAYRLLESPFAAIIVPKHDATDIDLEDLLGGIEPSPSNGSTHASELPGHLKDVGEIIDCLLRLSVTLSNPTAHDQYTLFRGVQVTNPEPRDIKHVQDIFPKLDSVACQRLGRAITRRRQYLKYVANQHRGPGKPSRVYEAEHARSDRGGATRPSPIPWTMRESTQTDVATSALSVPQNSTSYALSNLMDASEIRVPPIPKTAGDGPFLCPFCFTLISVETTAEWNNHVFGDLRPYLCIWNNCSSPEQDFHDRRDWIQHMTAQHWRVWCCPFGCSTSFNDGRALETHLRKTHAEDVAAESVDRVSVLSSRTEPNKVMGQCPMCHKVDVNSIDEYGSHIGQHLEQLALFALPAMTEANKEDHRDVGDVTETHRGSQGFRLATEPKARSPEANATSQHAISTKHSRVHTDDRNRSSGHHQEQETQPAAAQWFFPQDPLTQGPQRDQALGLGEHILPPYSLNLRGLQQSMRNVELSPPAAPVLPDRLSPRSPAAVTAAYGGDFGGMMFQSQQQQPDKPYQCDQCPTAFSRNHDLKRHKRIHWPVRPFPCDGCDKSFFGKDALKRHKRVKCCGKDSKDEIDGSPSVTNNEGNDDNAFAGDKASDSSDRPYLGT